MGTVRQTFLLDTGQECISRGYRCHSCLHAVSMCASSCVPMSAHVTQHRCTKLIQLITHGACCSMHFASCKVLATCQSGLQLQAQRHCSCSARHCCGAHSHTPSALPPSAASISLMHTQHTLHSSYPMSPLLPCQLLPSPRLSSWAEHCCHSLQGRCQAPEACLKHSGHAQVQRQRCCQCCKGRQRQVRRPAGGSRAAGSRQSRPLRCRW